MEDKTIEFLQNNGYTAATIFLILVLFYVIANPDKVMIWKAYLFGLFSKFSATAKKKQISNKVRGTILKSVKIQQLNNKYIIPSDLKVVWTNNESPDSFVQSKQVIVRVKQSSNPNENLAMAVSEFVNTGLLYNVKRYLNKDVIDVSRILMTRKIIKVASKNALTYLDEKYIFPKFENDNELKELYSDLQKIDNNGMFIDLLLNEFYKAGMTIYGEIEDPELIAESKEFMNFLYNIANRTSSDATDLCFNRDYFKVAVILSASNNTLLNSGILPFLKVCNKLLSDGIETIYIFGLGKKQEIAKLISSTLESNPQIYSVSKHSYRHIGENGRRVPGVFYECQVYNENICD